MKLAIPRSARSVLLFFVAASILIIIVQTSWAILQDRALTLDYERSNGLLAVRLLEEHASQTLRDAERELELLEIDINRANINRPKPTDAEIQQFVEQHLIDNDSLNSVQFINRNTLATSAGASNSPAQVPHLAFLQTHPDSRNAIIGPPQQTPTGGLLPMARNLHSGTGVWLGILSANIRLTYFSDMYLRTAKNNNALIALVSQQMIVRSPFDARYGKQDLSGSPLLAQLQQGQAEGVLKDSRLLDENPERLTLYRKLPGYALNILYSRTISSILKPWQQRTRDRILFAVATAALISLLTYFLLQHIRRLREARASLRHSQNKFSGLFQRSPLPLALMDFEQQHFIEANDIFLVAIGHTRNNVLGKTENTLQLWENSADYAAYLQIMGQQALVERLEVRLRHRDGHALLCLLSARLIELNQQKVILFSLINITQTRQIENEIRQLSQALEQRVRQRTQKLEETQQQQQESLASMKQLQAELLHSGKMAALGALVAGVAHELNAPIANSLATADALAVQIQDILANLRKKKLSRSALLAFLEVNNDSSRILLRNLERAADLVASFKQVAVDQASNQRREFDLRQTLEEMVLTLSPIYRKMAFKMELVLAQGIHCESYPGPLGQIISNFINNAILHGFENRKTGCMTLRSRLLDAEQIEIVFEDDGVGIAETNLPRVFEAFYTTKLGQGGSGLGMHIAQNLVKKVLGGTLCIESQIGQGTRFILIMPRIAPNLQTQEEGQEEQGQGQGQEQGQGQGQASEQA